MYPQNKSPVPPLVLMKRISLSPKSAILQVGDDGLASHANKISHVHISVLPNPSSEKKWKFL